MRILTTVLSLCVLLSLVSCGDEGVGFNIAKVVPVVFPVELEGINDPKLPIPGQVDPPAYVLGETFELSDVTEDVDLVDEIVIKGLSYKIEGVESDEDFEMDDFTITVSRPNGNIIADVTIFATGEPIANLTRTALTADQFDAAELTAALDLGEQINTSINVDFAEIPDPIDFDFTFYFDVLAKVRE